MTSFSVFEPVKDASECLMQKRHHPENAVFTGLYGQKVTTLISYQNQRCWVVEPRGVEPLSEDQKTRASPSAVCVLTFPPPGSRRQDSGFSSFIKSRRPQSLRRLVPCFYDADGLRRRRLRVDDRRLSGESYVIVVVSSFKFPLSGGSGPPLASLSLRIPVETKIRPRISGRREL